MQPPVRVAIATWEGRVAPVFDVATHFDLYRTDDGLLHPDGRESFTPDDTPAARIDRLRHRDVATLICGAIARESRLQAEAAGMEVIAFVAGDAERMCEAWLEGRLSDPELAMPGCTDGRRRGRNRRRHRGRCRADRQEPHETRRPSCLEETEPDRTDPAP